MKPMSPMLTSKAFITMLVASMSLALAQAEETEAGPMRCQELRDTVYGDYGNWGVSMRKPGNYCLVQDLRQAWPPVLLADQTNPMIPLVDFSSNKVSVDLQGHRLIATGARGGGEGIVYNSPNYRTAPLAQVRNGFVATSARPAVLMVYRFNDANTRFGRGYYKIASSFGDLSQYQPTEFLLENLTLQSDGHVIILQGKKNIIRNCKIIGGNGTVNVYGPNLVFENNELILHARDRKTPDDEPPVALYLEDAENSLVRHNRITIEGSANEVAAIVVKNSQGVILEDNIVRGAPEVYKLIDGHSSVKAARNTLH